MYRRRTIVYPVRRAKLPPGYRREKKTAARGLYPALDAIVETLKRGIKTVSTDFSRSEAWVRSQIFGGSKSARFLRATPKTRLYDAYVHHKAQELNKDLPPGEKWQLPDIKEKIRRERVNYKQRPTEEHERWIKDYEEYKEQTRREKRVNRKAEQLDATSSLKRISADLDTLHTRTGVRSVLIATRSDILFAMNPYIFSTQAAEDFFVLTFGKTLDQVVRAFEMFNIHGVNGLVTAPKNASELKHELRLLVQSRLTEAIRERYANSDTPAPLVPMNYKSYDTAIVATYRVRLIGWVVKRGKMLNPGDLSMPDARRIYDGLIAKTVYWEPVPDDESLPDVEPTQRKVRCDKDVVRGPNKRTRDREAAASAPKSKKRKPNPPSSDPEDSGSDSGSD
ncbi:hypothetical protein EXIGLDRAFT_772109 [Exidia glandulosa HHB12029]|uniref:Uncharacterized protein n=1 Tax=Exidia glandulosa HHB12029 TaxID=1314781 RepID=A0A165FI30_EXIGL|nr:hypothetical protein EXIGLDRAFT_772109 [Exidia glandulosa HHB12029]